MISGQLIRQRRIECGITLKDLASRCRLQESLLAGIENEDSIGDLSLGQLLTICSAVGIALPHNPMVAHEVEDSGDAAIFGAMVAVCAPQGRTADQIGEALGWRKARVAAAEAALREQLATCGMALIAPDGEKLIVSNLCSGVILDAVICLESTNTHGTVEDDEIALLMSLAKASNESRAILSGDLDDATKTLAGSLLVRGVLELDDDRLTLSEHCAASIAPVLELI